MLEEMHVGILLNLNITTQIEEAKRIATDMGSPPNAKYTGRFAEQQQKIETKKGTIIEDKKDNQSKICKK